MTSADIEQRTLTVSLAGFAARYVLPDPHRELRRLLFLPLPFGMSNRNVREVLHMASEDETPSARIEAAMQRIRGEHDIFTADPRWV